MGEGRAWERVVKEFEFEEYRVGWLVVCWGAHRCYFKSWGHQGLAETWSTLDGGRVDLYGVS